MRRTPPLAQSDETLTDRTRSTHEDNEWSTMNYRCHNCGLEFEPESTTDDEMYEFERCPECGSARTTLARAPSEES